MKWLLNFFRTDILRKLLALVLTGCVYFSVKELQKENKSMQVPLTLTAAPGIFIPEGKRVQNVTLELQGPPGRLQTLSAVQMAGSVTVQTEGQKIKLISDHFGSAFGIRITKITPEEIDSFAVKSATREVPVAALDEIGSPGSGYELESVTFDPATVKVSGPAAEVNKWESVKTILPVNIRGTHTYRERFILNNPNPGDFEIFPRSVDATVNIRRKLNDRTRVIHDVPVNLLFNHLNRDRALKVERIFPAALEVTVRGREEVVNKLGPGNVVLFADLRAATFEEPGVHIVPVRAELQNMPDDDDLEIVDAAALQVKVLISDETKKESQKKK